MKTKIKEKGITLIALVVTIIILTIIAGISITAITSDKGIIKESKESKEDVERKGIEEQIEVAILKVEQEKNVPKIGDIINELLRQDIIENESDVDKSTGTITTKNPQYEIQGKLDKYLVETVKGALDKNKVFESTTTIQDTYGNEIKIPEGFKIADDSALDVTGGIVIEDVKNEKTKGSQFVWIPVGTVYTSEGESEQIELNRYTFDQTTGDPIKQGENIIDNNYRELEETINAENAVAKDLTDFKNKAKKGYYIGRYEARTTELRWMARQELTQISLRPSEYIYMYVSQKDASNLCKEMYNSSSFNSDLMNSYAWDTAIVFARTFGDNKKYSLQPSKNTGAIAETGTNNLSASQQDKICNIFDMASNNQEWTTEVHSATYSAIRGGARSQQNIYAGDRFHFTGGSQSVAFRPILYL